MGEWFCLCPLLANLLHPAFPFTFITLPLLLLGGINNCLVFQCFLMHCKQSHQHLMALKMLYQQLISNNKINLQTNMEQHQHSINAPLCNCTPTIEFFWAHLCNGRCQTEWLQCFECCKCLIFDTVHFVVVGPYQM